MWVFPELLNWYNIFKGDFRSLLFSVSIELYKMWENGYEEVKENLGVIICHRAFVCL